MSGENLNRSQSEALFKEACGWMPGGVNSPVRAFRGVGGCPVFMERANGAQLWDADGNEYIDYVGSWGPAIVGHAHPEVLSVLQEVAAHGLTFGAPTARETDLAKVICDLIPSVDKVRFVSSGTEATMSAIRLARAYTKRDKFIKFTGCYHGHADALLVKAGSGVLTLGLPDSPGVPKGATADTLVAPLNDLDFLNELFTKHDGEIAGIILEPIAGNTGFIRHTDEFMTGLRTITEKHGALLIYDEVMTGFRVALGGVQELTGIRADITTYGKVIGGGMPVGAYGGRKDIMATVAPEGPMYQAGTLSGNPLAMASGLKTLEILARPESFKHLSKLSTKLVSGLAKLAENRQIPFAVDSEGGMFGFFFHKGPVRSHEEAKNADLERFKKFFNGMLAEGIYLAPSAFEAGFVSLAHTEADIDTTLAKAEKVFATL